MAVDVGSHFLTALSVNPGTPRSWLFLIDFINVLAGRENKTLVDIFNAILLVCHVMDVVGMMSCESVQCALSA